MSNMQNNSDNKNLINSEKKILNNNINQNPLKQEALNKNTLNNSKTLLENKNIILDTLVNITVELGKSKIKIKDLLSLSEGSMLILDKLIKEPLDIFVNDHLIASGEIVVSENKYGLRITSVKNSSKTIDTSV